MPQKPPPERWILLESHAEQVGWRTVLRNTYRLPDGQVARFDLKGEGPAVCILALTADEQVLLVQQYRPGPDRILLEMPGGGVKPGEPPLEAARRELLEETGYGGDIELAGTSYHCAHSTRISHTFVAINCRRGGPQRLDREEFASIVTLSLEQFRQHLRSGQLTDVTSGYLGLDHLGLLGGGKSWPTEHC